MPAAAFTELSRSRASPPPSLPGAAATRGHSRSRPLSRASRSTPLATAAHLSEPADWSCVQGGRLWRRSPGRLLTRECPVHLLPQWRRRRPAAVNHGGARCQPMQPPGRPRQPPDSAAVLEHTFGLAQQELALLQGILPLRQRLALLDQPLRALQSRLDEGVLSRALLQVRRQCRWSVGTLRRLNRRTGCAGLHVCQLHAKPGALQGSTPSSHLGPLRIGTRRRRALQHRPLGGHKVAQGVHLITQCLGLQQKPAGLLS
mmetsp:Transcript_39508/g.102270  ORF Transcript_39508/g.102270 Transcript_39508/m.102270 type:complete len:259 (+) Transcript_39508:177-953(+)